MRIKTRTLCLASRLVLGMLGGLPAGAGVAADLRTGEAVVASQVGQAKARVFDGPVHAGRTQVLDLHEGASIGETSRLITGRDGRLCVVLSPGAILCVAPQSELTIRQLRMASTGLPESEDDLVRRIHLELHEGRILVHAGVPSPASDIRVEVDAGTVEANGGTFVVAQNEPGTWAVVSEEYEQGIMPKNGNRLAVSQGEAASLLRVDEARGEVVSDPSLLDLPLRDFEVCEEYFQDLVPFIHDPIRFDRQGLSEWIGGSGTISFLGESRSVSDVSPAYRPMTEEGVRPTGAPAGAPGAVGRWDEPRILAWYNQAGVIKGVNYVPRNAVNSTEMWMEEAFDQQIIGEELGWAHDAGYTAVRVQLQYVVWGSDPKGFSDRLDTFLDLASRNGLRVVPVLFDDMNLAGTEPSAGPQPEPIPERHNARWTPSPGATLVRDRTAWPQLEQYVTAVLARFKQDPRVLYWDLYNTAGNSELWEATLPLMDQTFQWARNVDPAQPLAVAAWTKFGSAMSARMLERSDLITFQSFDAEQQVAALLELLQRYKRPMICSDWLMRQRDSRFDNILPLFAVHRVGWFNRGLVNGKTQTWIQQDPYRSERDPELWQHDVLKNDGTAYNPREVGLIQNFRYLEGS